MMLYLVKREFDNRQHVLALSVRTQTQTQGGQNIHTTSLVGSTLLKGTRKQILNEVAKKKKNYVHTCGPSSCVSYMICEAGGANIPSHDNIRFSAGLSSPVDVVSTAMTL